MRWFGGFLVWIAMLAGVPVQAGGPALPPEVARLFEDDAKDLVALCEDVIAGYGGPGGLDADGIVAAIGLKRADARAIWLHVFWAMDLEGDGRVSAAEREVAARAASASARARMIRAFEKADRDGDGDISPEELSAGATAAGLRRLDEAKAAVLGALMAFDADGNGLVTREEFRRGVALLGLDDDA